MSADLLGIAGVAGARRRTLPAKFVPMLAALPEADFLRPGWIYEPKMDGMRALSLVTREACTLLSRRALDITHQYPSLARALPDMVACDVLLDGEIVALNEQGRPSFQHLQQRINLIHAPDIIRAETAIPVYYFVFDVLYADGFDLCGAKLADRKAVLAKVLTSSHNVNILSFFKDDGMAAYQACVENGFEGIVAKRLDSIYEPGRRSPDWIKVKAQQTDEFVVGGFTQGQGSRASAFGALLLGSYDQSGHFIYCGSVGTGFDERLLRETMRRVEPLKQAKHPFLKRPDEKKIVTWLKPQVVVEVKFMDWTRDFHLRTPVFLRFRDDKDPQEVKLQRRGLEPVAPQSIVIADKMSSLPAPEKKAHEHLSSAGDLAAQIAASKGDKADIIVEGDTVQLSHLDKIMWMNHGDLSKLTKREFLIYIASVSPFLLHYLKDRPLSVVRSPDGMKGKRFYQKHWNFPVPDFVETIFLNDGADEAAMCNNVASLLWYAQHGVMEYHVWLSRIEGESDAHGGTLARARENQDSKGDYPDFLVFDVDCHSSEEGKDNRVYKKDSYLRACEAAHWLKEALVSARLKPYLKTSGRNGLHVFVPIVRTLLHDEVRVLAETISRFVAGQHKDKITLDALSAKHSDKVLLDCSPNCKGKTLIAPYSPRLVQEQTVSMPLQWQELGAIYPIDITMSSAPDRLRKLGDLWADCFEHKSHLEDMLQRKSRGI